MAIRFRPGVGVALLAAAVLAGCANGATPDHPRATAAAVASSPGIPADAGPSEPQTWDAVKVAADRIDAAGANGDGGGEWDMLTAAGQAAMGRGDYVKVVAGCPGLVRTTTWSIYVDPDATSATVTVRTGPTQSNAYTWEHLVYENGHWRQQPSDGVMAWMHMGVVKALAGLRDNHLC